MSDPKEKIFFTGSKDQRRILLAGDTHGQEHAIQWLATAAHAHQADGVFVLGDFGWWDHADGGKFTDLASALATGLGLKIWTLPGNHENYDLLEQYEKDCPRDEDGFVEVKPGLLHSPRGHRWTWNGVNFLSMGGAYSIDKDGRIINDWSARHRLRERVQRGHKQLTDRERYILEHEHWSWWPQEEITVEEVEQVLSGDPEVDVLLTHDKPLAAEIPWNRKNFPACVPNQEKLQRVVEYVRPSLLCHGHFHYPYTATVPEVGTFVRGFDCDEESSRYSGGSGDWLHTYGLLRLLGDRYTLSWHQEDEYLNRDFIPKHLTT